MAAGTLTALAIALLLGRWIARAPAAPVAERPVQLTSAPAFDGQPTLAPDGKRVAFVSERRGVPEIWIRSLPGAEELPLNPEEALSLRDWDSPEDVTR